jgi:hypothetical protein
MMTFTELASVPSDPRAPFTDRLRLAVAAYLTRFKDTSREHTESDLRCYLAWCAERGLDPLAAQRPHLELYIRWMQEIRRFKPSAVSRRLRVCGKGTKVVLVPLPPPVGRALDQATGSRARAGPAQPPRRPDGPARGHLRDVLRLPATTPGDALHCRNEYVASLTCWCLAQP